jgi:hypothetical protein
MSDEKSLMAVAGIDKQSPMDLAASELMDVVRKKEASGLPWDQFVKGLRLVVEDAQHELDVALKFQDVCSATKPRKKRSDAGTKRKKASGDAPAEGGE